MKTNYRKSVPKSLKDKLWDTTFGASAGEGLCYVCGIIINSKCFEAGHVISVYDGGGTNLQNLKCICSTCNKSMGTRNLEEFKRLYFPQNFKKSLNKKVNKKVNKKEIRCYCGNCTCNKRPTINILDEFKFKGFSKK
jgi:5-methylcytosine-specific restriction endonuclease McrA